MSQNLPRAPVAQVLVVLAAVACIRGKWLLLAANILLAATTVVSSGALTYADGAILAGVQRTLLAR